MIVDYSANVEEWTDMPALCDRLRCAMIDTGALPLAGVRVRAHRADHVSIADGGDRHGFIDLTLRLRAGRDTDTKRRITRQVFDAAQAFLAPVMAKRSLALSFELRDIDPEFSPKTGTIRDHLSGSES
jgi:5-carboxymethyl-2-hydroxymuconate isomerase